MIKKNAQIKHSQAKSEQHFALCLHEIPDKINGQITQKHKIQANRSQFRTRFRPQTKHRIKQYHSKKKLKNQAKSSQV
jgi:hypothetical protein